MIWGYHFGNTHSVTCRIFEKENEQLLSYDGHAFLYFAGNSAHQQRDLMTPKSNGHAIQSIHLNFGFGWIGEFHFAYSRDKLQDSKYPKGGTW